MSEFWSGVTASLISAIIGASLTFVVTWFFSWRQKNKEKDITWNVIKKIITDNYVYVRYILKQIEEEEKIFEKDNKYSIEPFPLLKTGFTEELMFYFPKPLKDNYELFLSIKEIEFSCSYSNDYIYKINEFKGPLPINNRNDILKKFNKMLEAELLYIIEKINCYENDLLVDAKEMKNLPERLY